MGDDGEESGCGGGKDSVVCGEEGEGGWWWKTEMRGLEGGGLGRRRGRTTLSAIFSHRRVSRGLEF